MKKIMKKSAIWLLPLMLLLIAAPVGAQIYVQCPGDLDGDLVPDPEISAGVPNPDYDPNVVCVHLSGGDGFARMADGYDQYMFSFGLVASTDQPATVTNDQVLPQSVLKARLPAPLIELQEGQELYLTLSNVGMVMRPDLFDPHSVHYHGFPNAAPIFDGLPEPSPTPNMGASITYYYKAAVPGTYFYHCHVEAAEHMQMGMIGNAWIKPAQDGSAYTIQDGTGRQFTQFAYNDGDGSTGYDVAYPFQMIGFDSVFHDAHIAVQALPFASMYDNYPMVNGRGYPDTINTNTDSATNGLINNATAFGATEDFYSQQTDTLITADAGQRILLRLSNVSTTHQYTVANTLGVPFKIIGRGAAQLTGPTGIDTSRDVNVINVAGGQAYDVILDTNGVEPGTYFIYTTDLANLSNGGEERGGIMTEVVINAIN